MNSIGVSGIATKFLRSLVASLLFVPVIAAADTAFYTDRAAWNADVLNPVVEDFSQQQWSFNGTLLGQSSANVNGTTFTPTGAYSSLGLNPNFPEANPSSIYGFGSGSGYNGQGIPVQVTNRVRWQSFFSNGQAAPMTITLSAPTQAIGMDLGGLWLLDVPTFKIAIQGSEFVLPGRSQADPFGTPNGYSFLGAISSTYFSSFSITAVWHPSDFDIQGAVSYGDLNPVLDNLTVATISAAPIPEPETYAMMLAGLGLLSLALRRKHF